MSKWYFTLPPKHPLVDYAIIIEAPELYKMFEHASILPNYKEATRYYSDPKDKHVIDKEKITLDEYKTRMEALEAETE